jgi:hypothetical protein
MSLKHSSSGKDSPVSDEKGSPIIQDEGLEQSFTPHDANWDGTGVDFSHIDQKKVLRKMDLHIMPMLTILYLLSFLDRGNIGNAKIEGLSDSLHLTGAQYNWCLTVFFFTYCAFEVPSNLMYVIRSFKSGVVGRIELIRGS